MCKIFYFALISDALFIYFSLYIFTASTKIQLTLANPDFTQHRVDDVFHSLGPVSHFSAKKSWTAPRPIILKRTERQGFGFSVRGDAPVALAGVDSDSLAEVWQLQPFHLAKTFQKLNQA